MICADKDPCPFDPENDADSDSICGDVAKCLYVAANDKDNDLDQDSVVCKVTLPGRSW